MCAASLLSGRPQTISSENMSQTYCVENSNCGKYATLIPPLTHSSDRHTSAHLIVANSAALLSNLPAFQLHLADSILIKGLEKRKILFSTL